MAQTTDYRNREVENNLISAYAEKAYLDIAQDELTAWENTFNTGYDAYYADMLGFWPQLYRTSPTVKTIYNDDGSVDTDEKGVPQYADDTVEDYQAWVANGYWNPFYITYNHTTKEVSFKEPEAMFFWIDFFDADGSNPELFQSAV